MKKFPNIFFKIKPFQLPVDFVNEYRNNRETNFGFGGLGETLYYRSYSRIMRNGENEDWVDTTNRVVEGTFDIQKQYILNDNWGYWNERKAQESAQKMFEKIFNFKFLPAGRGLYAMGTPLIKKKGLYASLNSCAFVSTENIDKDFSLPFCFLMDLSMLGTGVGFDCKGKEKIDIKKPMRKTIDCFQIPDDREGWVESLKLLLESYFLGSNFIEFDYSLIRPEGEPLKIFGGVAAGHIPLQNLHEEVRDILENSVGKKISVRNIVDIMNIIGKCVISGNIRRTSEIALGDYDDEIFCNLKNYKEYPERSSFGWASNNSIFAELGMKYDKIQESILNNGEPGLVWLENIQGYSRIKGEKDFKDYRAQGCNPCVEQTLESYEMCCLVETFPHHHKTLEEYLDTLKSAFLYAKTVSLGKSHFEETNEVIERNRRIGVSISGVAQFVAERGLDELRGWCEVGYEKIQEYDEVISSWFGINKSIKTTTIKPSGSVSILAGATPGVHFAESKYYIRRIRISKNSHLTDPLIEAGYNLETDVSDLSSYVVEFPVKIEGKNVRTVKNVSMWEKLSLAAFMQKYWSDNQVSCTVTFDKEKEGNQISNALNFFQYQLKGISFLPIYTDKNNSPYKQIPYEEITKEEYEKKKKKLKKLKFIISDEEEPLGCSNDNCDL